MDFRANQGQLATPSRRKDHPLTHQPAHPAWREISHDHHSLCHQRLGFTVHGDAGQDGALPLAVVTVSLSSLSAPAMRSALSTLAVSSFTLAKSSMLM
jgi:hypothetical protein